MSLCRRQLLELIKNDNDKDDNHQSVVVVDAELSGTDVGSKKVCLVPSPVLNIIINDDHDDLDDDHYVEDDDHYDEDDNREVLEDDDD